MILESADVAELLGWSTRRTRRWLLRTGAGVKRAGRVVTTRANLMNHAPEMAAAVLLHEQESSEPW